VEGALDRFPNVRLRVVARNDDRNEIAHGRAIAS
jgi:hypothetical protein